MESQWPALTDMIERRVRTAVRVSRMTLAQRVLDQWRPDVAAGSTALIDGMLHIASGGDAELPDVASSATVADAGQVARVTADAFERGRREGIEDARRWQLAGLDPERWPS